MITIVEYLRNGVLPKNRAEAVKVKARDSLMIGVLYQRSFSGPYLRCLPKGEVERVMEQVHYDNSLDFIH